jgi:polar amino acid transport system substrate-binding protein
MKRGFIYLFVAALVMTQTTLVFAQAKGQPLVGAPPLLRPGKLIIATNATIPPVQFIDDRGNLKGMRIELGDEIARRLNLESSWVNIQFEAMIPGLQGLRWDMINTGLFYTEERAKMMSLVPYELQAISVSVPKGNPHKIKSTEDMAKRVVAVEVAGYEERNIKAINQEQVAKGMTSALLTPLPIATRPSRQARLRWWSASTPQPSSTRTGAILRGPSPG